MESTNQLDRKYLIRNEILNAVTHGIGAIMSITALVLLLMKSLETGQTLQIVSYSIYGGSLILLYTASTLYHSFTFTKAKKVFQRIDHSSIFLLIAGTYTPYTLLVIQGTLGWLLTIFIWMIAIFGVLYKSIWFDKFKGLSLWIYIGMGWVAVFFLNSLYRGLGLQGFLWLIFGGLSFSVGAIFYKMKHVHYMHVVWHLFVLLGTICMFFSIYLYT
ncbi:PAQR family membrane homeostasis protein TrhA [Lacticigenium naphthae]|uniref:PAQR family membrane homeostasis protein TrhA n=1 Tax=Lacticigenium naphthae TaxID=515351 RepID=UPI0004267BB9|nr:hemolysin III family protein [Lacticigenium naphthae]